MTTLRLAIVGAGPAGIYAADILLKAEKQFDVSIDLFDHLPAPYGLVRYGVAPDHPRIKGIIKALREVLDRGAIRLFGNVHYGRDITLGDLKKHYNAVIFSTGAVRDASLNIPGIELAGSYGAGDFVSWYDGHPDYPREWPLDAKEVAVIGNGNVALDVARMLAKHAEDLLPTEVPANVYEGLHASAVTDVHIFGRRGPAQVKFTPLELRELGELRDVDMILHEQDFDLDDASRLAIETNKQIMVLNRVLNSWREREVGQASRRLHMHFYSKPVEILAALAHPDARPDSAALSEAATLSETAALPGSGSPSETASLSETAALPGSASPSATAALPGSASPSGAAPLAGAAPLSKFSPLPELVEGRTHVAGIRFERTEPDDQGGVRGTGEFRELPVQAVYRAVGYFGSPLDGIPFDEKRGVIPNREGQVIDDDDQVMPGVFATGWIKRGPVGLIGHTKSDAMETVKHLMGGQQDWWSPEHPEPEAVTALLDERGVKYTNLDGWHNLDAHEKALGEAEGRERIKVVPRDEMVRVARDE